MVHGAYDSVQLLKDSPSKIESVALWNTKLYVACNDGSLRLYSPNSSYLSQTIPIPLPPPSSSPQRFSPGATELGAVGSSDTYALEKAISGFFARRGPISIEALASRNLLLTLTDAVYFHRLPALDTAGPPLPKTKGANVYTWDDRRGYLAVARQRKLIIFRHEGGIKEFSELKELNVPDTVKSMAWCGDNICLGIRKEYIVLNTLNGATSEVFPCGRLSQPSIAPLPSGDLLLGKDNIGLVVDQNGKKLDQGQIAWSEAPASVCIQLPYAIARLQKHIEIRSLKPPYQLVQTVALKDVHFVLSGKDCVLAALDTSVHALLPVPIGAQIVQLTASGNFEEALALCKLLPPEDSSLCASKEQNIHLRYGHYLFENGSYEEAMEQFLASLVDITYVLSMYPSILVPHVESEGLESPSDASFLPRFSSDASDDMEGTSPPKILEMPLGSDDQAVLEHKIMNHNALMALIKYLQKKRFTIIQKATSELTDEAVADADAVFGSMTSLSYHQTKQSNRGRYDVSKTSRARELSSILDTALLQALILTEQISSMLDLLKQPNYCDVKICEDFLRQRKHFMTLVELYKCNGMHREALTILTQLLEESEAGEAQTNLKKKVTPNMILDYLKPLGGTDPLLVLDFALRVLEHHPSETIELFLLGSISPDLVNSYLKQHAPHMQAHYLEHLLSMNEHAVPGNLQNELLQYYLSEVLGWYATMKTQQNWDEKSSCPTRKKLLSALEDTSAYNPEILLRRLPSDGLYKERALLLGKMKQHQLALSIYVHKLSMPELALAYCDNVYETSPQQLSLKAASDIYVTLLQIYLNPKKSSREIEQKMISMTSSQNTPNQKVGMVNKVKLHRGSKKIAEIEGAENMRYSTSTSSTDSGRSDVDGDEPNEEPANIMIDLAMDLLTRRWDRINGAQALRLLPRQTKLKDVLPFLEPLLKKSSERHRNCSVIKSLRQSENLQVKEDFFKNRRRMVTITNQSMCSLCNKRIGTSVFAVYPNGETLVHFVCFRDSQNMKAGRGASALKTA